MRQVGSARGCRYRPRPQRAASQTANSPPLAGLQEKDPPLGPPALLNSRFGYPSKSVTINLATAHLRKEGAGFDLPMALGILGAMGVVNATDACLLAERRFRALCASRWHCG
jgi:hypothetical protein